MSGYSNNLRSFYVGHTVKLYMNPYDEDDSSEFTVEDIATATFRVTCTGAGVDITLTLDGGDIEPDSKGRLVAYYTPEHAGSYFVVASAADERDVRAVKKIEFEVTD